MESIDVSNDATVTQNPPNFTPYSESRGEEWTGDLNVGHGAAPAVAAVCTLTLGDLAQGGTLADSNGQAAELQDPHAYATGSVGLADATAAGSIAFGEHEAIEFEAKAAANASTEFTPLESYDSTTAYEFGLYKGGENYDDFAWYVQDGDTPQDLVDAINDGHHWYHNTNEVSAELVGGKVVISYYEAGEAGNDFSIVPYAMTPFATADEQPLENGQDARTPQEVVDALNASEDCPAVATLDADELGISFTAKEYGVNDTIAVDGGMFENAQGMSGGKAAYTRAELVTAIGTEFSDITAAAGEAEGTITLTAYTAGKAANAVTYTATGCFGSGSTRQGSTTRGKDTVEQTAYKIYLNGVEQSGGGQPTPPAPTALEEDTEMENHGIYLVTDDIDAQGITLAANATAEIWVRIGATALNVQLPGSWEWVQGAASEMDGKANATFCIAVRNDGVKVLASMAYSYDTTPAQS